MNALEKANVMCYHKTHFKTEKESPKKLGWTDSMAQQKRFAVLSEIANLDNQVVLDVGCGFGDLKKFLEERFHNFTYIGIDYIPEFILQAKDKYQGQDNTHFQLADYTIDRLPQVDYVLCSGAMSYQTENTLFPFLSIEKMFRAAKKGIAFNLLNARTFTSNTVLKSYEPEKIIEFCTIHASHVELIEGYLPEDFTIMMYK